ncbi:hypothetical protein SAMN04487981_111131 [Streptomyces sp. cf386]|uniref:hypothetical protein n=1 Tax=Streptomyces sp. cf386 TaxID=1761904 RepID=UPI000891B2DA|nr:hypothetical protein [Streptomyces sp. cf386]SDO52277.1 hypothetical protein SAMN04487981_111131 [Streptomyces sp. cf386]
MRTQDRRGPWDGRSDSGGGMATAPRAGLRVVGPGAARGPLEPGRLLSHAAAALHVVVDAVGAPASGTVDPVAVGSVRGEAPGRGSAEAPGRRSAEAPGTVGLQVPGTMGPQATGPAGAVASATQGPTAPGTLSATASDAVGACYLDLWICDRLLRHDGGNRSAAARCLVPVLLLEGVGAIAPVLGARLHRPDAVAVEYRRRRRVLVRAVRERSPQTWERLGHRLARIATGEDRLARPLTPVRGRGLPKPLSELVGLLEAERRELAAAGAESAGQEPPHALLERCALLAAAAACLDGWQEAGPHRDGRGGQGAAGHGIGRPGAWPTAGDLPLPGPGGGAPSASGSSSGPCTAGCPACHHPPPRHSGPAHPLSPHPTAAFGVSARRARLCGALYRLAVRLDLRVSDGAGTAWRADVLRCAVA